RLSRDVAGPCLAPRGSVVAVGAFDGLHRGHQALLARVHERARELECTPMVVSFEPLPRAFFSPEPVPRLSSVRDKLRGFAAAGMEHALLLRFNRALTTMSAEDFVRRVLVGRLAAREVWVGGDSASATSGPAMWRCWNAWARNWVSVPARCRQSSCMVRGCRPVACVPCLPRASSPVPSRCWAAPS